MMNPEITTLLCQLFKLIFPKMTQLTAFHISCQQIQDGDTRIFELTISVTGLCDTLGITQEYISHNIQDSNIELIKLSLAALPKNLLLEASLIDDHSKQSSNGLPVPSRNNALHSKSGESQSLIKVFEEIQMLLRFAHLFSPEKTFSCSTNLHSFSMSGQKDSHLSSALSSLFSCEDLAVAKSSDEKADMSVESAVMMNVNGFSDGCVSLIFAQNGFPLEQDELEYEELLRCIFNHKVIKRILNFSLERNGIKSELGNYSPINKSEKGNVIKREGELDCKEYGVGDDQVKFWNSWIVAKIQYLEVPVMFEGEYAPINPIKPPNNILVVISQRSPVPQSKKIQGKIRKLTIEPSVAALFELAQRQASFLSPKERQKMQITENASGSIASSITSIVQMSSSQPFLDQCLTAMGFSSDPVDYQDNEARMQQFETMLERNIKKAAGLSNPFAQMVTRISEIESARKAEDGSSDDVDATLEKNMMDQDLLQQLWIPMGMHFSDEHLFVPIIIE